STEEDRGVRGRDREDGRASVQVRVGDSRDAGTPVQDGVRLYVHSGDQAARLPADQREYAADVQPVAAKSKRQGFAIRLRVPRKRGAGNRIHSCEPGSTGSAHLIEFTAHVDRDWCRKDGRRDASEAPDKGARVPLLHGTCHSVYRSQTEAALPAEGFEQ